MRIHLDGDWSATRSFIFGAIFAAFFAYMDYSSTGSISQPALPVIACVYLFISVVMGILAKRGREVLDGSTWVSWNNSGGDVFWELGSGFVLYGAGFGIITFLIQTTFTSLEDFQMLGAVLIGLIVVAWGIIEVNFGARVVVFTPQKEVLLLKGRPCIFLQKKYHPKDWLGLHVSWQQGYSGGMSHTAPDNLYYVWGLFPGGAIQLNILNVPQEVKRVDALKQLHEMVEETAEKTGLPVPPWPADKDIYFRLYDRET